MRYQPESMTRIIKVVPEAARIDVTFFGPVGFADRIDAIEVVAPSVQSLGLGAILIDYTHAWVDDSTVEAFKELERRIQACGWLKGLRVALVSPAEFHAVPTEQMSREVGFEIRRFYTRPAAVAWLSKPKLRDQRGARSGLNGARSHSLW